MGQGRNLFASPWGLPIGLQLYSVRDLLKTDFEGTLKKVAALGYKEAEAAGFYGRSPQQVRAAMDAAGLHLVSAHFSGGDMVKSFDQQLEFCHAVGTSYIICSFPWFRDPARLKSKSFPDQVRSFSLEDYKWNADQFNKWGEKAKSAGLQFGYHNHTMEFTKQDGKIPFDELIRNTDPKLVTFEMDCGWVSVGGGDPVHYLKTYPTRISMLHVKDFKHTDKPASVTAPPPAAELGTGTVDFRPIFAAASPRNIKHYFVEQEEFNLPPMESLKIDEQYMAKLQA